MRRSYLRILTSRHVMLIDCRRFVVGFIPNDFNTFSSILTRFFLARFGYHVQVRNMVYVTHRSMQHLFNTMVNNKLSQTISIHPLIRKEKRKGKTRLLSFSFVSIAHPSLEYFLVRNHFTYIPHMSLAKEYGIRMSAS